jgi:hypothetical protein
MFVYQVNELKRNPSKLANALKQQGDSVVANDDVYILFPKRWEKLGYLKITDVTHLLGNFLISDSKGNSNVPYMTTQIITEPTSIESHIFGTEEYFKLVYKKGDAIIKGSQAVQDGSLLFGLFEEYFIKGNIPPYFTYDDIFNTFINGRKYTGSNIADDPLAIAALTSMVARQKSDMSKYYRTSDIKEQPVYIGLNKVERAFSNAFAKITGNYFKKGLRSAVITDENVKTDIEQVMY